MTGLSIYSLYRRRKELPDNQKKHFFMMLVPLIPLLVCLIHAFINGTSYPWLYFLTIPFWILGILFHNFIENNEWRRFLRTTSLSLSCSGVIVEMAIHGDCIHIAIGSLAIAAILLASLIHDLDDNLRETIHKLRMTIHEIEKKE